MGRCMDTQLAPIRRKIESYHISTFTTAVRMRIYGQNHVKTIAWTGRRIVDISISSHVYLSSLCIHTLAIYNCNPERGVDRQMDARMDLFLETAMFLDGSATNTQTKQNN